MSWHSKIARTLLNSSGIADFFFRQRRSRVCQELARTRHVSTKSFMVQNLNDTPDYVLPTHVSIVEKLEFDK